MTSHCVQYRFNIILAASFKKSMKFNFNIEQLLQTHGLSDDTNPPTCTKCDGLTKMCSRKKCLVTRKIREYTTEMCVQKG